MRFFNAFLEKKVTREGKWVATQCNPDLNTLKNIEILYLNTLKSNLFINALINTPMYLNTV